MSIQREYSKYILQCDICPEAEEFDSFNEARAYQKANGWKQKQIVGEWFNFCPECEAPTS